MSTAGRFDNGFALTQTKLVPPPARPQPIKNLGPILAKPILYAVGYAAQKPPLLVKLAQSAADWAMTAQAFASTRSHSDPLAIAARGEVTEALGVIHDSALLTKDLMARSRAMSIPAFTDFVLGNTGVYLDEPEERADFLASAVVRNLVKPASVSLLGTTGAAALNGLDRLGSDLPANFYDIHRALQPLVSLYADLIQYGKATTALPSAANGAIYRRLTERAKFILDGVPTDQPSKGARARGDIDRLHAYAAPVTVGAAAHRRQLASIARETYDAGLLAHVGRLGDVMSPRFAGKTFGRQIARQLALQPGDPKDDISGDRRIVGYAIWQVATSGHNRPYFADRDATMAADVELTAQVNELAKAYGVNIRPGYELQSISPTPEPDAKPPFSPEP